ncbi:MAG: hypothetical protein RLZZ210_507 [Pseudomonadota bacterium]|jgi:hypothetical protein
MLLNNHHANFSYISQAQVWDKKSTVRSRQRRIMEDDELSFYPRERQFLCQYEEIKELGEDAINFILLQSFYKYLNDVIIFEMDIVNNMASKIAGNSFSFEFPMMCRQDAFSILIDENYHAYAAIDYMQQVIEFTGIQPLKFSNQIELSDAIPQALQSLDTKYHAGMELIAVGIAENSVTADVAKFARDKSLKKSIQGLMSDHLIDEGRHSIFWSDIGKIYWQNIQEDEKIAIGQGLHIFMQRYLSFNRFADFQKDVVRELVKSFSLDTDLADDIIDSIDFTMPMNKTHPMMQPIGLFLNRSGILQHQPTYECLKYLFQ